MTRSATPMPETTTVEWVGVGLDDEVGFELHFDRAVSGRFPTTHRRAVWVQGPRTMTAELTDLPDGIADLGTCHRILSALVLRLRTDGFGQVVTRRLPADGGERELIWLARARDGVTDHRLLIGVCTLRSTIATLRMSWTSATADPATEWPAVRTLLDQWKVTVR